MKAAFSRRRDMQRNGLLPMRVRRALSLLLWTLALLALALPCAVVAVLLSQCVVIGLTRKSLAELWSHAR